MYSKLVSVSSPKILPKSSQITPKTLLNPKLTPKYIHDVDSEARDEQTTGNIRWTLKEH